ncbi:MAG: recombinase family protein, partial [Nanoarchaeota archaeon]|nr:recombinase family protein [Nanoarchaeota archaeon]
LGEVIHRPPFGYTFQDKKLVPDPENSENLKEIFEMWAAGVEYKEISKKFDLSSSALYQIVKNQTYLGKIKYKGQLYKGKHRALVSEDLFNAANKIEKKVEDE